MTKRNITFDKHLNAKLVSTKKGYCRVRLDLKAHMLNHGRIAHGGVLATLCDISLAAAVGTVMKKEEWCVTAQLNIQYLYPALPKEPIYGFGQLVKKGNTLAFVEGGIETKSGKLIARAQGIWVIKTMPVLGVKGNKKILD